jgi:RNA polymerase sigma factor (TIGR02999 family)
VDTVTSLLRNWREGDQAAFDELVPLVYSELRKLAARQLRGERASHTFRPTELVAELYLKLAGSQPAEWNDRVHFFAVAARSMRQVLVDHARRRDADKRGGGERPVELPTGLPGGERATDLVELDRALDALAQHDERKARVVELHYFGGLEQPEIAKLLGVHVNTVARDLRFAESWLFAQLQ